MTAGRAERAARPLVILGPTASGKSDLALAVARLIPEVELVSVDSMQVYRGMNIGTATPTETEQREIRHHLIDLVDPSEEFAVGSFQAAARSVLGDIESRGAVAVLVGGTGLYLRAIIDDLDIPARYPNLRRDLEADPDTAGLHRRLAAADPVAAARMEPTNRRRIVRALEVTLGAGRPFSGFGPGMERYPETGFVQVALRWDRATLDERIAARYRKQLAVGFLEEVAALADAPLSRTAAHALGYRELLAHRRGQITLDEAIEAAVRRTRRFARRQERWFRRDPRIVWVDAPVTAAEIIEVWDNAIESSVG